MLLTIRYGDSRRTLRVYPVCSYGGAYVLAKLNLDMRRGDFALCNS